MSDDPVRWQRVKRLFQAALDRLPEQRAQFIREACADDHLLRREVESLLLAHGRAADFAERPAIDALAASTSPDRVSSQTGSVQVFPPHLRLGPYQVAERIGRGGMGEVYRAVDTRLGRAVAIKVLPLHVANDPDLRQRFEREARILANLSHPHICPVFDVGRHDGIGYLVMEHLEGETLAARLARGPLPLHQAIRYAMQIADALEKAHRKGVVHRDLKPGNVMLTKTGATLLDFGLAKRSPAGSFGHPSAVAAVSGSLTGEGTIVGTLHYMAPEQVQGLETDARCDIFSFGAVLYEMVTGKRALEGSSGADVIVAILERDPPSLSVHQPLAPRALDRLVKTCLAKDPDERWQSAGDIKRELEWIAEERSRPASGPIPPRQGRVLAALVLGALVSAFTVWALMQPVPLDPPQVLRFTITSPTVLYSPRPGPVLALSPDGRRVAFLAEHSRGGWALYVRELDQLTARMIPGSEIAPEAPLTGHSPFFSPDGAWLVFRSPGKGIMRASLGGGSPVKLLDDPEAWMGGVWRPDDTVIVALGDRGLLGIPVSRPGSLERLTEPTVRGQGPKRPKLLPGGDAVVLNYSAPPDARIGVVDLKTRASRILIESGDGPIYTSSGHLVFLRGNTTLMAAPFDLDRMALTKEPVPVLEGVRDEDYAISQNGTLAYVPADDNTGKSDAAKLVWMSRAGRLLGDAVPQSLENPRGIKLSPDSLRLAAVTGPEGAGDLWVHDLTGRPPIPLFDAADNNGPVWSPDGTRVAFTSGGASAGSSLIYWLPVDGSEREPHRVDVGTLIAGPTDWSQDGELVVSAFTESGGFDIRAAPVDPDGRPRELVASRDVERGARLSPDGRWLAYESNRSGQLDIWVRAYSGGPPTRVSQTGGVEPVWSRDGRELYYLRGTTLMAAKIDSAQSTFTFEAAAELFDVPSRRSTAAGGSRSYDVAGDGRFIVIQPSVPPTSSVLGSTIVVVPNWLEELKRLIPVN